MKRKISLRPSTRLTRRLFLARTAQASAAVSLAVPSLGTRLRLGAAEPSLALKRERFGALPDGTEIERFTLANGKGLEATVMTFGATLTTLKAPDRQGQSGIITLYLDTLADYVRGHPLFGSVVGRFANRIAGARFTLDGVEYKVTANAGPHHIHGGGREAFHQVVWKPEAVREANAVGVRLSHVSGDGEAGYPGTLQVSVTYKLTVDNELVMDYTAKTDKPTVVNLTNHAYWNLAGAGSGDVLGHELFIVADHYLPSDAAKIPTGEIRSVAGTPMDFRKPTTIGARIAQVDDRNYDHCYVLKKPAADRLALAARVVEPKSGRVMEVSTTQPGVQIYTARGLSDNLKGGGKPYAPYHGVCLETQHYPDAPNKPNFPSTVLRPGQEYRETTVHKFSVLA